MAGRRSIVEAMASALVLPGAVLPPVAQADRWELPKEIRVREVNREI